MRRLTVLIWAALVVAGCGSKHSLVGYWKPMPQSSDMVLKFEPDGTVTYEIPDAGSIPAKYSLDANKLSMSMPFVDMMRKPGEPKGMIFDVKWEGDDVLRLLKMNGVDDPSTIGTYLQRMTDAEVDAHKKRLTAINRQPIDGVLPEAPPTGRTESQTCLSNLRQLATAGIMYAQDYDETMPDSATWGSGFLPYVKNEKTFSCPTVVKKGSSYGYAFNSELSRYSIGKISAPATVTFIFDSTSLWTNAADNGTSLPSPPRHEGHNNLAFADGHVKSTSP